MGNRQSEILHNEMNYPTVTLQNWNMHDWMQNAISFWNATLCHQRSQMWSVHRVSFMTPCLKDKKLYTVKIQILIRVSINTWRSKNEEWTIFWGKAKFAEINFNSSKSNKAQRLDLTCQKEVKCLATSQKKGQAYLKSKSNKHTSAMVGVAPENLLRISIWQHM